VTERRAFPLRIDPELYEALQRWAAEELRSVNAQIEFVLRRETAKAGRLRRRGEAAEGGAEPGGAE